MDAEGDEAEGADDVSHNRVQGMEQDRKEDAQHPKAIFREAVQSAYRRSRSNRSVCSNVSPQTKKQTMVHPSALSLP